MLDCFKAFLKTAIHTNRLGAAILTGLLLAMGVAVGGSNYFVAHADQQTPPAQATARSVVFPPDVAVGVYSLIEKWDDWPYPDPALGPSLAQGEIRIPVDRLLGLVVDANDLHMLDSLRPDDVQHLVLSPRDSLGYVAWVKLRDLEHLTGLQGLTLRGNRYSPLYGAGHTSSNSVRRVFRAGDFSSLTKLRALRRLDLHLTDFPRKELARLVELPRLETLVLDQSSIDNEGLAEVGQCRWLRRISLVWTGVSEAGIRQLAQLKTLESIDLSHTPVTVGGMQRLATLPALKELKLGPIEADADALQQLEKFPSLERLTIRLSESTDQDLRPIQLPASLKHLRIDGRKPITDRSVLKCLTTCDQLESLVLGLPLRLEGNGLTELRQHEKLRSLSLRILSVGDTALASLRSLTQLTRLTVSVRSDRPDNPDLPTLMSALDGHPNLSTLKVGAIVHRDKPKRRINVALPKLKRASCYVGTQEQWASEIVAAHFGQLTTLEELELTWMHLSDNGLRHFERLGNLKKLKFNAAPGTKLTSLRKLSKLEHLQINNLDSLADEGLADLSHLTSLKSLALIWAGGEVTSFAKFAAFNDLEALDLSNARLANDQMVGALTQLDRLKRLNISGTQITADGVKRLRKALPQCNITTERYSGLPKPTKRAETSLKTDDDLARLKGRSDVQSLSLGSTDVTDAGLVNLRDLTSLWKLTLTNTRISDQGLSHLRGLSQLRYLVLDQTQITDKGLAHLSELRQLRTLSLARTRISDVGLAHLSKATRLKTLYLSGTQVKGKGLATLTGLEELYGAGSRQIDLQHFAGLAELRVASLKGAQITGSGLAALARLKNLRTLNLQTARLDDAAVQNLKKLVWVERLALDHTNITDDALQQLAELKQLEFLALDHNQITDEGVAHLVSLKNLDRLDLGGTKVTDEGIRTLQAALPDCEIHR